MEIRKVKFSEMDPAPYNPRIELTPDMQEFQRLADSMEVFGNVEPIVWNQRTGHVVGGHQRLAVLKYMGETSADVSVVDMDEDEERLLNLALNKIKGDWDYQKLEDILRKYSLDEAQITGFGSDELALLLSNNDDILGDDFWEEDDDSEDMEFLGGSWVITLVFDGVSAAQAWLTQHNIDAEAKEGAKTTVIRMEK